MKKTLLTSSLIAGALLVGCESTQEESAPEEPNTEETENDKENPEKEVVEVSVGKDGSNPFSDDVAQEDLTDYDFQSYIHGMSHQKIEAGKKWTFYKLTQERVGWLLGALDKAQGIEHKSEYKHILDKWSQGDFSTADEDHNTVWSMQGGTVGRATGVLSSEQEQAYIESAD